MGRQMNGWANRLMIRLTNGWIDRQTAEWEASTWMDGRMEIWMDERIDRWTDEQIEWVGGSMDREQSICMIIHSFARPLICPMSISLSARSSIQSRTRLSNHPSANPSVHPFSSPSGHLSICLPMSPPINLCIRPSTFPFIYLPIRLSVCSSIHQYVHLPTRPVPSSRRTDEWRDEPMKKLNGWIHGSLGEQAGRWMEWRADRLVDQRVDKWMDWWMD